MEFNMNTLSVRWKLSKDKEWGDTYQLSEKWKGKKVYVFIAMMANDSSVECELVR